MKLDDGKSLFENLALTAAARPDAPALSFLDPALLATSYTFGALFERVNSMAAGLAALRLDPDMPVGILLESQHDQVLHYLAVLRVGLVPAILTPPNRKLDRAYYLKNTDAVIAYCRFSTIVTDIDTLTTRTMLVEPYTLQVIRGHPPTTTAACESVRGAAFLQFSSGTTGIKRGVLVANGTAIRQLNDYGRAIGLTPADCIVSWLPLYHDMGFVACLNLPLAFGAHAVMLNPLDWVVNPALYLQALHRYRGSLGWLPNFAFSFMAKRVRERDIDGIDLSAVRGLVNCSEPVTHSSQQAFRTRFAHYGLRRRVFWGCYAMAETTFALTHTTEREKHYLDHDGPKAAFVGPSRPFVCVGRPLPGVELKVVGDDDAPLPDRHVGEFCVRSPYNVSGYFNNAHATQQAFAAGWYRTGDLGYLADNRVYICGRKKDLLILAGVNIYPADVEDVVGGCAGILSGRVAVFSRFDADTETESAVILAESGVTQSQHLALEVEVRRRVTAAFQISGFELNFVPPGWLVKSSSGKMARKENRDKWRRRCADLPEFANERSA